ncbi:MAG: hypothetical protein GEU91_17810 [Rhizobiales bacterium]|nr:hypothetical protein [Hyphomicrobiales bacterium]
MAKVKEDTATDPSIAELASSAKTADQHGEVVKAVTALLDGARRDLAALENGRESVVLSGGNLAAHSRSVSEAGETLKTLTAARAAAQERYQQALRSEQRVAFERDAAALYERAVPALTDAWRKLHGLLSEVEQVGGEIERLEREVSDWNSRCRQHDRLDLVQRVSGPRERVAGEIGIPFPPRLTPVPVLMPRESEEAFALRVSNHQSQRAWSGHEAEPLRVAGKKAVKVIERLAVAHPDLRAQLRLRSGERIKPAQPLTLPLPSAPEIDNVESLPVRSGATL